MTTKRGRPSKLTPEIEAKILEALRAGNFREVAAEWAGVSQRTFKLWVRQGKDKPKSRHGKFLHAVLAAERSAEIRMVAIVMKAATEDAKHAEWWLERKFHERWGRKDQHQVTGKGGKPLEQAQIIQNIIADEALREALDAAAARAEHLARLAGSPGGQPEQRALVAGAAPEPVVEVAGGGGAGEAEAPDRVDATQTRQERDV